MSTIFGNSRVVLYIPPNYVTTDTAQSISGQKTFNSLVTCTDSLSTNEIIFSDNTRLTTTAGLPPTGSITMFAAVTVPTGWLLCDGSQYSTTDPRYSNLFSVIGYGYNYASTPGLFRVPDFRGIYPSMPGTNLTIKTVSPFEASTMTGPTAIGAFKKQSLPFIQHDHYYNYPGNTDTAPSPGSKSFYRSGSATATLTSTASNKVVPNAYTDIDVQSNVTPVSLGINYIIKL